MALQRPNFPTSRFVEAYDTAQVDDAVDRIFAALSEPTPSMGAADIRALRFTPTRLRDGYTMDAVDDWLDQAGAALAAHTGPTTVTAPEPSAYAPTRSEAIVEVGRGSGSARWLVVLAVFVVVAVLAYVSYA